MHCLIFSVVRGILVRMLLKKQSFEIGNLCNERCLRFLKTFTNENKWFKTGVTPFGI